MRQQWPSWVLLVASISILTCKSDTTTVDPSFGDEAVGCPRFSNWPGCGLWPTDDGHEWKFDVVVRGWNQSELDTLYVSLDDIPPLPTLDEAIASFGMPAYEQEPDSTNSYELRMSLRGFRVTPEGDGRYLIAETVPAMMEGPF
jgi:hypothetical protein